MNLLTPTGYKDINDVNIGDELIAYDINTGVIIINTLLKKELWTNDMLPSNPPMYQSVYNEETLEYEEVLMYSGMSSEQVFQETHGDWKFYEINGTWKLYKDQSVWANMKVIHIYDLQIGDIIYDDEDNDVIVTSIVECVEPSWWRLEVSGDHSYISDNLQLHNASRYWQKQNASFNWNATGPTNWGSASGVSDGASVPTSVDDVFFDGVGANGNINSTISATITVLSINISSGYTSTMTHNAELTIAGNVTLSTPYTIAGTQPITISAASTITSNGKVWPNILRIYNSNTKTLVGDLTILGRLEFLFTSILNKTTNEVLSSNGVHNLNGSLAGTATLRLTGGTISQAYNSGTISIDTVRFDGNITFNSSNTGYNWYVTNFSYVSGTVTNANLVTLGMRTGTYNWDIAPIKFGTILAGNAVPITINLLSKLNCTNLSLPGCTSTFSGSFGFECDNFTTTVVNASNCTLTAGNTYLVNNSFSCFAYGNFVPGNLGIRSSSATVKAILTIKNGSTCNTNAWYTRIDSSGGRTINTWNATVTDCVNVRRFTDLQTVSGGFIN